MKFCPFISTPTEKKSPSQYNCKDCCFYVYEHCSKSTYCAINLAAERSSNLAEHLIKDDFDRH